MPTLASRVVDLLQRERLTLAVAESCTGGLLGGRITRVPGAGEVFLGGVICYQDEVKADLLRVDRRTLAEKGAVTREVAAMMAEGARELFAADIAVSVTGFAGPNVPPGGELGRVFLGLAHWGPTEVHDLRFADDRESVREGAVDRALEYVLDLAPRAQRARS